MHVFFELAHKWRARAGESRDAAQNGDSPAMQGVYKEIAGREERCANELDAAVVKWQNEELTIKQAAEESGYDEEVLRRAVRDGRIPNAGRKGSPKIRRADLPRKL